MTIHYDQLPPTRKALIHATPEWRAYDVLHKALIAAIGPHGTPYPQREHDEARRAWEAMEKTDTYRVAVGSA